MDKISEDDIIKDDSKRRNIQKGVRILIKDIFKFYQLLLNIKGNFDGEVDIYTSFDTENRLNNYRNFHEDVKFYISRYNYH